ncbi:type VI secretion system ATPase TssH [Shewanella sp. 202IG2-18]|uniref:type VI secretion system ATPase TssH n=1 Tax=Parashewanella hymeniacidonis TaxID=2807618 RepID=UPI0019620A9D|nr:type VI secretion system ATPase TssH [Parashewanella hymeniacidonis]MBM7071362.1 type VI secretion system ATPase TssH [Parashewanella hymeniacidonis]
MVNIELQNLIKRLTPQLKFSLEESAGECLSRQHFSIELEHWFFRLFQNQELGWIKAVEFSEVDREVLVERLNSAMARYSKGNDKTPSLSPQLVDLLKDAWLLATLNHEQASINEFHLLLVLKQRTALGSYAGALSDWVNNLSTEWLKQQAKKIQSAVIKGADSSAPIIEDSGETPALNKYAKNITEAARNGELDQISGRNIEIRKSIDILCRRRQNSPILVGDPGVGKTAIVEGLSQQIVDGSVPPALSNVELYSLDLSLLQAGASIKGEFENRLKDIINEIKHSAIPIIIFIDEAHTLIGAGGAAGQNDAANILKPALARGEFRTIAATTWAEYKQFFETDAALTRRFQKVAIDEPDEQNAIHMLSGVKSSLEKHHNVTVLQEAIDAAVSLSIRYLPERKLPDKAISLLDTACSRIALSQSAMPQQMEYLAEQIRYVENEINTLNHESAVFSIDSSKLVDAESRLNGLKQEHLEISDKWEQEKTLVAEVIQLQDELDKLYLDGSDIKSHESRSKLAKTMADLRELQGDIPLVVPQVSKQIIADVIALWTGIPAGNMLKQEVERIAHLEAHIAKRVIGQEAPIAEISQAIRLSRAGLRDPRKPIGIFLMCGPSGVGKTETALALTDELYGGEHNAITINMTEFKEEHKISMLLGAPAGYVGYGKGGVLTEAVRKNPYSVLLLDEMEKAHPGVHDIFYQIFDKGSISDSEGRKVDFKNTIIIMTSNAADSAVVSACNHGNLEVTKVTEAIFPELKRFFKPAFLGRTTIVPYFPLTDDELAKIAELSLKRIEKRIKQHYGATFSYDDSLTANLVARTNSPETGARAIEQAINRSLMPDVANECIDRMSKGMDVNHINISVDDGKVNVEIK